MKKEGDMKKRRKLQCEQTLLTYHLVHIKMFCAAVGNLCCAQRRSMSHCFYVPEVPWTDLQTFNDSGHRMIPK